MKFKEINLDVTVNDKKELFQMIAHAFKKHGVIQDEQLFVNALEAREQQTTTGLINQVAIPHGVSETVNESSALMFKLSHSIDYETLDGSNVIYVFALAVKLHDPHLDMLMDISSKLMEDDCIDALIHAKNEQDIIDLFK